MSLLKLRQELDNKKISAVELTQYYLSQIAKKDKTINSFISTFEENAIEEAKKAQEKINLGTGSFLTGIPVSIKDNICVKNTRTTCASRMLADFVSPYDATAVRRLKETGAIIIGKTNMDEFAMGSTSQTSYFGGVKNPYNYEYVPGGSSGGSAASVCADMCVASLGTDTGGSVRQPSAFCGVTGIKPTYGAVSRYGLVAFASSLEQIGVIASTAEDTAYVLNAICGYDNSDLTSSKKAMGNYHSLIDGNLSDIKIGMPKEFFSDYTDCEVKNAVLSAIDYYKQLGHQIIEVSLPSLKYAVSAYYLLSSAEAASNLSRYDGIKYGYRCNDEQTYEELIKKSRSEGFGKEVKRRIMLGNYALSNECYEKYYRNAMRVRTKIVNEYRAVFEKCDVIITPTTPTAAYKISDVGKDVTTPYLADVYTVTANIAGLPSISTTCGYNKTGLPIGMSITGKAYDEKTIIAVCDRFEKDFERRESNI